jgi:hypothetical protein
MEAQSEQNIPVWERQPGEKKHHYEWFHVWLMLGPSRSLVAAYNTIQAKKGKEKQSQASGAWHQVFEKWRWRERAAAWDVWQQQQSEERLRERQQALEDRLFTVRERLVEKVEKMLDFPLAKVTSGGSGGTTIIEPVRWNLNSVARLLAAQKMLGGESDIVKYIDLSTLSEEQLLRLSKGESIYKVLGLTEGAGNEAGALNPHDDIADSGAGGT